MNKKTLILLAFIILKFVLQYILVSPSYELQRDEYLHLDQANHLAWGYLSSCHLLDLFTDKVAGQFHILDQIFPVNPLIWLAQCL